MFFAKQVPNNYFNGSRIVDSRCVLTNTNRLTDYESRGGLRFYKTAKDDVVRWLIEDAINLKSIMIGDENHGLNHK